MVNSIITPKNNPSVNKVDGTLTPNVKNKSEELSKELILHANKHCKIF